MRIKLLPSLIILILITVGIMGFLSMSTMNLDNPYPCPFSLVADCSVLNDPFMALHHLSGVEYFSQVIVDTNLNLFILFTLFVSLILILRIKFNQSNLVNEFFYQKIYIAKIKSKDKKSFLRWLSIIRYIDSILLNRVYSNTIV